MDGFKNLSEVAAGESFPVLFSWSLGSSTAHDEMGRQVVLGIEAKPGICLDLGEVDACPSWSNGIGSGLLTAPAVPGTYQVQAAAVAAQDCAQAMAAYAAADNRLTVGTVVATGSCGAVDCDQLGAACGLWEDGCGEILHCGQCGSGGLCQQGTCAATPACADDTFVPSLIDLGGQGATAAYAAWDAVSFALPYRLAAGTWCPACARQVVLGSGPVALACEETGKAAQCPNTTWSATGGIFTAPPVPGTYLLRAALIAEADCPSALAAFGQAPSVPVGLLTVEGGCSPWSCEAMDRECGDWGDGCGGFLHCGSCPEGFTCTAQGQCQSPCAEGIFQVSEVSINGSGTAASAAPGKNAPVSLSYAVGNPEDCADCPRFLVVGLEDAPGGCKELGTPPACPATAKGSFTTPVQAPAQAGSYGVYAITTGGADCADASAKYASSPYRKKLGTLHVTSGCQPKSCVAMGKDCGSWEDGCDFLLQCGSCAPGKLCDAMGQCYCTSADPYEPNNTPGAAYDLGDHTDKDGESKVTLNGAVHGEADWFRMGATDVQWAYMEPYVHLVPGLPQKFEVTVAYRCLDGLFPGTYNEKVTDHCTLATDVSLPGVGVAETAWICTSTAGEEVVLHFGPHCATMNDSGELYVGVSSNGPCSSYELDLHL